MKINEVLKPTVPQYKTLNDVATMHSDPRFGYAKSFKKGTTAIWYYKSNFGRDAGMGVKWLRKQGMMPTATTLKKTHVLLGEISIYDKELIFQLMQGENWSPQGEAFTLIKSKKLKHTSMSVGDVMEVKGELWMVDSFGFEKFYGG